MSNLPFIAFGKAVSKISKTLNRGNGSTWPGHIALKGNPNFIRDVLSKSKTKVIIVAGTNGKTTTSALIRTGLEQNGFTVFQNRSGANLLNGIASAILLQTNTKGNLTQDYAIFEVDENALPLVLEQTAPDYIVLLNLFRDQLDRYGEINTIVLKWQKVIAKLPVETKLVLNADDPQIASIPVFLRIPKQKIHYFGLQDNKNSNSQASFAADSVSCPKCSSQLIFDSVSFSHLGKWHCPSCGLKRPQPTLVRLNTYPLLGTYNKYNIHAAFVVLQDIGMNEKEITNAFTNFKPAFGRQEVIRYKNNNVQLFLSKNPTSFNQSFATIKEHGAKTLLFVLNDRIPDGRDISWIWDTDLTGIEKFDHVIVSGDRVYDIALRLKYELGVMNYGKKVTVFENVKEALNSAMNKVSINETLYILPTYSAMLDVRKIITGKKIL
jgi:lipid II isoglutaminyl synthase (glutamine-hydrolysing)